MSRISVIVACLFLAGCMKTITVYEPVEVEIVRTEYVPVPEALLTPCEVEVDIVTNADMERVLTDALLELNRCTDDKEAIRALE